MKSNILAFARAALKKATHKPTDGEKMMAQFAIIFPDAAAYAVAILPKLEQLHKWRRVTDFDMTIKHAPQDLPRLVAIKIAIEHYHLPRDIAAFTAKQRNILRCIRHTEFKPNALLPRQRHAA